MNKEAIKKSAVCRFVDAGGIYVVESPLLEMIAGADPSEARAWETFHDLLEAVHQENLKGKSLV